VQRPGGNQLRSEEAGPGERDVLDRRRRAESEFTSEQDVEGAGRGDVRNVAEAVPVESIDRRRERHAAVSSRNPGMIATSSQQRDIAAIEERRVAEAQEVAGEHFERARAREAGAAR